jgi:hypothetical protein
MAFPATSWFKKLLEDSLENTAAIDLNDATAAAFKVALYTNAGTGANLDTDIGYSGTLWTSSEVVGTAYTAGGTAVTTATPTVTVAASVVAFDCSDVSWTTSTITARGALLYYDILTAGSKYGVVAINFGSDLISTAGTFSIVWNASGVLTFT